MIDFQLKNPSLGDYAETGKFIFEIKPFFLCEGFWINNTCYEEGDSFELEGKNYSVVDGSLVKVDEDSLENNVVNKLTGNAVGIFESSFETETNKKIFSNEEKSFFDKLFKRLVFWN